MSFPSCQGRCEEYGTCTWRISRLDGSIYGVLCISHKSTVRRIYISAADGTLWTSQSYYFHSKDKRLAGTGREIVVGGPNAENTQPGVYPTEETEQKRQINSRYRNQSRESLGAHTEYGVWSTCCTEYGSGKEKNEARSIPTKSGSPLLFFSVVETLVQIRVSLRSTD